MILLVHTKAKTVSKILRGENLFNSNHTNLCEIFWELAEKYPNEIIFWVEEEFSEFINFPSINKIFTHNRIMASYAVNSTFFSQDLGYIDQLPFVNVNRNIKYPTWLMSTDLGGIKGATLYSFKSQFEQIKNFGYLLNSVSKIGQQNGLLCYSEPELIKSKISSSIQINASPSQEFSFVYQHYNTSWTFVFFWCLWRYKNTLLFEALIKSFFQRKHFGKQINLPSDLPLIEKNSVVGETIDVIIPTLGRPEYLIQVLKDLEKQSLLPSKVLVVEQNLKGKAASQVQHLNEISWPFEVKIETIDKVGVCNARNIALREVTSNWIFFADDDIRFSSDLLQKALLEAKSYNVGAINMNCKQVGQETIFHKVKQWGSFGSGTSIVKREYASQCSFSTAYEHGYGEDSDYGMQLRNKGCDILYHPNINIIHLKAPSGGFRSIRIKNNIPEMQQPKPSPTIMAFAIKHFTMQQMKGFKAALFLKYYKEKISLNPFRYVNTMRKRWKKSEEMANVLLKKNCVY